MTINTKDVPRIELKAVGEKCTLCVEQARKLPFGKFPEAEFYGMIGSGEAAVVVMPMAAALKQLGNLNLGRMDEQGQFYDATGKYLTFMRSENKTNPARPYWDIYLARAGEFEGEGAEAFAADLKRDPLGTGQSPTPPAQRVQRPPDAPAATPKAEAPVAPEEVSDVEKRKRAKMVYFRKVWHALWKDEALSQLRAAAEIATEHPEFPVLLVTGESVNAGAASQFIKFDRDNLL